ncbi:hypothetical protein [Egibacter rhizosphaerae]|nr:hypothetical protein [Egibacter rhizosphaerae]
MSGGTELDIKVVHLGEGVKLLSFDAAEAPVRLDDHRGGLAPRPRS